MYYSLYKYFEKLATVSTSVSESWHHISFEGNFLEIQDRNLFKESYDLATSMPINMPVQVFLSSTVIESAETFIEDLCEGSRWKINFNKSSNLRVNKSNFFYDINSYQEWAESLNPFDSQMPLNLVNGLKISVRNFSADLVGANFTITSGDFSNFSIVAQRTPLAETVDATLHILSKTNFTISPQNLVILNGECNNQTLPFFQMAAKVLAATLTSEIIDDNTVILRGIRKIDLTLFKNVTPLSLAFVGELQKTVEWIYDDKTDLKLKLFLDRMTLDINYHNDYVSELARLNLISLSQAKERFLYITFERKDQYQKELRDLLKDLKTISELYSTKARTVLSNLLRDVLAGFLLIGITLLSKIENVTSVLSNQTIEMVFRAFGVYFLLSIIYQLSFDLIDIYKTKREFIYWKQSSREYIPDEEFQKHLLNTIGKRELFTLIFYLVLTITYLTIAYLSWDFMEILKQVPNN